MLQVLYQSSEMQLRQEDEDKLQSMFERVDQFLVDQGELFELKKLYHISEMALNCTLTNGDTNNSSSILDVKTLPMIDVALDMLRSQSQHKRAQWEEKSKHYIELLPRINEHLVVLLQKMSELDKKSAKLFSLSETLPFSFSSDEFAQEKETFEANSRAQCSCSSDMWIEVKNKTVLWLQCYQGLSRLVL